MSTQALSPAKGDVHHHSEGDEIPAKGDVHHSEGEKVAPHVRKRMWKLFETIRDQQLKLASALNENTKLQVHLVYLRDRAKFAEDQLLYQRIKFLNSKKLPDRASAPEQQEFENFIRLLAEDQSLVRSLFRRDHHHLYDALQAETIRSEELVKHNDALRELIMLLMGKVEETSETDLNSNNSAARPSGGQAKQQLSSLADIREKCSKHGLTNLSDIDDLSARLLTGRLLGSRPNLIKDILLDTGKSQGPSTVPSSSSGAKTQPSSGDRSRYIIPSNSVTRNSRDEKERNADSHTAASNSPPQAGTPDAQAKYLQKHLSRVLGERNSLYAKIAQLEQRLEEKEKPQADAE